VTTPTAGKNSFNSPLIAQVDADKNGFYQIIIPAGHYSYAIVEDGKLYASGLDEQGGLNSFTFTSGIQKMDILLTDKIVF
jgi:hypothetical protein